MKFFYLFLFISLFQNIGNCQELLYSLDSTHVYDGNDKFTHSKIVTEKNADGYTLKLEDFEVLSDNTRKIYSLIALERFSDNSISSSCRKIIFSPADSSLYKRVHNSYGEITDYFYTNSAINFTRKDSSVQDNESRPIQFFVLESRDFQPFEIVEKNENHYSQNKLDSTFVYSLSPNTNVFVLYSKTVYQYDSDGDQIKRLQTVGSDLSWLETNYTTFNGEKVIASAHNFELQSSGDTLLRYKATYNYEPRKRVFNAEFYSNAAGDIRNGNRIEEFLLNDSFTVDSVRTYGWNFSESKLELESSDKNFYTKKTSFVEELEPIIVTLFPNPAQDFLIVTSGSLTFDKFEYQILNSSGQMVSHGNSSGFEKIETSGFSSGNYFLRLDSGVLKPFAIQR